MPAAIYNNGKQFYLGLEVLADDPAAARVPARAGEPFAGRDNVIAIALPDNASCPSTRSAAWRSLVMVFVNQLAGVGGVAPMGAPREPTPPAMSFVDVVFPAFLFIVGMSIAVRAGRSARRAATTGAALQRHVLARARQG